jgi:hypothetical protein
MPENTLTTEVENSIVVTNADREGGDVKGNLTLAAEERIVDILAKELPGKKIFSINATAELTHTGFALAKRLRSKAIAKWAADHSEEMELQKEKIRRWTDEIEKLPPDDPRVQQIKNTIELYEKLNSLEKISPTLFGSDGNEIRFIISGKIGPNMLKLFEGQKKVNIIEQDAINISDGSAIDNGTAGVPESSNS